LRQNRNLLLLQLISKTRVMYLEEGFDLFSHKISALLSVLMLKDILSLKFVD